MKCPFCAHVDDKVIDSREGRGGDTIRRRRECLKCSRRFTTYERIDEIPYMVIKKDGRRERFERQKILQGLLKACEKRPVATPNAGTSKASQAFWAVSDVAQEVAELKKRGVEFEHYDAPEMKRKGDIHTGGGARAAWFKDSEGNILAIIQSE